MVERGGAVSVAVLAVLLATVTLATVFSARMERSRELARQQKGKELVSAICSSCHTLQRLKVQHWSQEEWRGEIKGMLSEGAAVTPEETDLIVEYLAKNFGEKP